MNQHADTHGHGHGRGHADETELADLLDLDAEVLGVGLDQMVTWAGHQAGVEPRVVVDLGAGTGTGTLALARRFASAQVVAVDQSAAMLDRIRASAASAGLAARLRCVQADLDVAWPLLERPDLVWAASSMHHLDDPGRLIRDVHAALAPGGVLVVVELDTLPRFLPDDIGIGRPGLEERCRQVAARRGWNAHPDWQPHLERAGFEVARRGFPTSIDAPVPASARRLAYTVLRRFRLSVHDQLAADDIAVLDRLLSGDASDGLQQRDDLTVRGSRTAWAARRR